MAVFTVTVTETAVCSAATKWLKGTSKADIVKATYFVTRPTDLPSLGEIRRERWGTSQPPSVTTIVVAALARLDYLIEIEVVAAAI